MFFQYDLVTLGLMWILYLSGGSCSFHPQTLSECEDEVILVEVLFLGLNSRTLEANQTKLFKLIVLEQILDGFVKN